MPYEIANYLTTSGKKLCIRQMKYKKEIVFCSVTGAYIIFWRDKKVDHYWMLYIIPNSLSQIK